MLKYLKGHICNGHTFVVNKEDVHNARDDMFVEATALLPDEWISVKERLPPELTPVLIYTEETGQGVCMAFLENGKWIDGYSGRGIVLMQQELVTHWMYLPEPPKEDLADEIP